jgi:hypothetical protein
MTGDEDSRLSADVPDGAEADDRYMVTCDRSDTTFHEHSIEECYPHTLRKMECPRTEDARAVARANAEDEEANKGGKHASRTGQV